MESEAKAKAYESLAADPQFQQLSSDWKSAQCAEEKKLLLGEMLRVAVVALYGDSPTVDLSDFLCVPPGWTGVNSSSV